MGENKIQIGDRESIAAYQRALEDFRRQFPGEDPSKFGKLIDLLATEISSTANIEILLPTGVNIVTQKPIQEDFENCEL